MAKTKSKKRTNTKPFNFYGARKTSNPKYYSVTLVRGSDDKREWLNVPVNKKNIKLKDDYVLLKLSLLEDNRDDDDDDEDDDDEAEESATKSKAKAKAKAKANKTDNDNDDDDDDDDDLPF